MAVDASKLKRRRGLGVAPTEGAPGIEEAEALIPEEDYRSLPPSPDHAITTRAAAQPAAMSKTGDVASTEPDVPQDESEVELGAEKQQITSPTASRGRGGEAALVRRQRVPPPEAEPRVPFTTRVTLNTKERLEDACYHLRRKHQDFINEAILAHLKKYGF